MMNKIKVITFFISILFLFNFQIALADYRTPEERAYENLSLEEKTRIAEEYCRLDLVKKKDLECEALGYNHPLLGVGGCWDQYNEMAGDYAECFNNYCAPGMGDCLYKIGDSQKNTSSRRDDISNDEYNEKEEVDKRDNSVNNSDFDNNIVGLPADFEDELSSCIGIIPKNSELCPGDDQNVLDYTEKHLVDSCSLPEGSDPKCEYVCKTEHLNDGTCKEEGFFKKILNWFGGLF